MYYPKDVSIIIPTYNRSDELKLTLKKNLHLLKEIREILIIDQSIDGKTKKLMSSFKNKKLKYFHLNPASLTKARNFGVTKVSKSSEIVIFFDDDLDISSEYLQGILEVFNKYPKSKGVSGFQKNPGRAGLEYLSRKIFLLENSDKERARAFSAYGATYPSQLNSIIQVPWLTGHNMAYKKEIFKELFFDERLSKYALGEDFDFSYRVNKKYPGSLFLTPHALVVHRVSDVERYPTEKISYMNQINHFYLNFKSFDKSIKEKSIFYWNIIGLVILKSVNFLITRKKTDLIKLKFFTKSLIFCLKNIKQLRELKIEEVSSKAPIL